MSLEPLRLLACALLVAVCGSGFLDAASAQAGVCDVIPSIPMVPNPITTGCNASKGAVGPGPGLPTSPGGALRDLVTAPIKAAGDEVMRGVTTWVTKGAGWLIGQAGKLIGETTTPRITGSWFLRQYRAMGALAAVFALPLLLLSILQGVLKRDGGVVIRGAFVQLPLAFVLTALAVTVAQLLLQLTDEMSATVASSVGNDAEQFFKDTGNALGHIAGGANPIPLFAVFLAALVGAAGAFCVWLELLVRSAAIYVALLFLPFTFVAMIWPATARWCRRLVETLIAIIFAKFVIVAIMALAAAGLGQSRGGEAFQGVLAGAALMVLAAFSPFVLLRLIPMAESAAVGVGWRRGAFGGALAGPGASPAMVMRRAMNVNGSSPVAASSRGSGNSTSVSAAGGSSFAGGAAAGGIAGVQAAGRATGSRLAGIGSYQAAGDGPQIGGAGAGVERRTSSPNPDPTAARPSIEPRPLPPLQSDGVAPPEPPAPRPRDREGGLGGG